MKLGDAFIWREHLWCVISIPNADGIVVLVNFTSHEPGCDESCVIEVGEHPFVKQKTVIDYNLAQVFTPAHQRDFLRNAQTFAGLSDDLIDKIQAGTDSDLLEDRARKLVIESAKLQRAAKKAAAAKAAAVQATPAPDE